MIGALDGTPQNPPSSYQDNFQQPSPPGKGKRVVKGAFQELQNLQNLENSRRNRSVGGMGKENSEIEESALRMSHLRGGQNVDVYRIEQERQNDAGCYPRFLKLQAEKENCRLQFPQIPKEAWKPQSNFGPQQGFFEMPLLRVDRSVPGQKFPGSQRDTSLPRYQPDPRYFASQAHPPPPPHPQRSLESPDSGIGIPLLRMKTNDDRQRQPPRFGELLPPDMVIESKKESAHKEFLRERYLREYHDLQVSV